MIQVAKTDYPLPYCETDLKARDRLISGPEDPRYFDLGYFPAPAAGQNGIQARLMQVEAVAAREAQARGTMAYQIKARRKAGAAAAAALEDLHGPGKGLRHLFPALIPHKPFCADNLQDGLLIRQKTIALKKWHLQLNAPGAIRWIAHDLDYACTGKYEYRDAGLPIPNVIVINRANGHAHGLILLKIPVASHDSARRGPLAYLAAVERAIARRLRADRSYSGLIAKNPLHARWQVDWCRDAPFTLDELDDSLFFREKAPESCPASTFGFGRNCTCFDQMRAIAYREVLDAKRTQKSIGEFKKRLEMVGFDINHQFSHPLPPSEIRAIAKSVAGWTWSNFSVELLSQRQSRLGRRGAAKRWAGHVAVETIKPWASEGISKRTWYRKKRRSGTSSKIGAEDLSRGQTTPEGP